METKMNTKLNNSRVAHFNFSKVSPEALDLILTAMNSEVDRAIQEGRGPLLEKVFKRLCLAADQLPVM